MFHPPVSPQNALPGRTTPILTAPQHHLVFNTDLLAPIAPGQEEIFLAAGCFWGVEEIMWQVPGVVNTATGYMGGYTPNPEYGEVCTELTGHAETVRVVYQTDTDENPLPLILKTFWECHDPTSLNRQGNDIGTQYRSAIFYTTQQQRDLALTSRDAYDQVLTAAGRGRIVTEVRSAVDVGEFYWAELVHQQYLISVPNGYRCHAASGLACPLPGSGPLAAQ